MAYGCGRGTDNCLLDDWCVTASVSFLPTPLLQLCLVCVRESLACLHQEKGDRRVAK